jgi:hypothetical protein
VGPKTISSLSLASNALQRKAKKEYDKKGMNSAVTSFMWSFEDIVIRNQNPALSNVCVSYITERRKVEKFKK